MTDPASVTSSCLVPRRTGERPCAGHNVRHGHPWDVAPIRRLGSAGPEADTTLGRPCVSIRDNGQGSPDEPVRWHHSRNNVTEVAQRLVPLEGTLNFRDLGGYPTSDGRRVRWGRVYRSDSLAQLTQADWARLHQMGIGTIVDFRRVAEVEAAPTSPPPGTSYHRAHFAIGSLGADQRELLDRVLAGEIDSIGVDEVQQIYMDMVYDHAESFGALLTTIAEPGRLPVVFHCTAGKDRTGLAAAFLLSALGVREDLILDDYELTNRYRTARRLVALRPRLAEAGVELGRVLPYLSAPRQVMAGVLSHLDREFGSVSGYLTELAGVDRQVLEELRRLLVEHSGRQLLQL